MHMKFPKRLKSRVEQIIDEHYQKIKPDEALKTLHRLEAYWAKDELDWAKEDKLDKMIWTRDEIAKALDGIKSYIESYPDLEWSEEDK